MQSPKRTLCKRSDEQILVQDGDFSLQSTPWGPCRLKSPKDPKDLALGAKAADRWLEVRNNAGLGL